MEKYFIPILKSLVLLNGSATVSEVMERVYPQIRNLLTYQDVSKVCSGEEICWRNRARWAAIQLKKKGYIFSVKRGTWQITTEGLQYLCSNIVLQDEKNRYLSNISKVESLATKRKVW